MVESGITKNMVGDRLPERGQANRDIIHKPLGLF